MTLQRIVFWLRLVTLIGLCLPALYLAWRWCTDDLGARPVTLATHVTGDWTVVFLLASLALTPARAVFEWMPLVQIRRRVGVAAALYALAHFTIYAYDQKWNMVVVALEILKRFYLTIGFVALVALVLLALTSTDGWQRRLRGNWRRLHKLVFPAAVLAILHFFIQSKANVGEATVAAGLFAWLMIWRGLPVRLRISYLGLLLLMVLATACALGFELAWYGLVNHVDPKRILNADLNIDLAPRPVHKVLLAGFAVIVLVLIRRGWRAWNLRRKAAVASLLCLGLLVGHGDDAAAQALKAKQVVRIFDATLTFPPPLWAESEDELVNGSTLHREEKGNSFIIEMVRKTETFRTWTAMLKVSGITLANAPSIGVRGAVLNTVDNYHTACGKEAVGHQLLKEEPASVLYSVVCGASPHAPAEMGYGEAVGEITVARVFLVKNTIVQIEYCWRGKSFDFRDHNSYPVPLETMMKAAQLLDSATSVQPN